MNLESEKSPLVDEEDEGHDDIVQYSLVKLGLITVAICGVQMCWAAQNTYISAFLLMLGLPSFWVSLVWIVSPLSGIIVQPIIGAMSDISENRWGRRRPYMVGGTLFIVLALLLVCNSLELGESIGGDTKNDRKCAIILAIVGLSLLDCNINLLQGPLRTLFVDLMPSGPLLSNVNAFASFWTGFGTLLGAAVGSINLPPIFPFFYTQIRAFYTISAIVLIICVFVSVFVAKEEQFHRDDSMMNSNIWKTVKDICSVLFSMPSGVKRVCSVQFFVWYGFFAVYMWGTAWVGRDVFEGDPDAPKGSAARDKFEDGVRWGSLGIALNAFISLLYSPWIPSLMRIFGAKIVYFISIFSMALGLLSAPMVTTKTGSLFVLGICGLNWGAAMTIPYAMVGKYAGVDKGNTGLYMAAMNLFLCFPEILCAFTLNWVIKFSGGSLSFALFAGGCFTLVGSLLVPLLRRYSEQEELHSNLKEEVEVEEEVEQDNIEELCISEE